MESLSANHQTTISGVFHVGGMHCANCGQRLQSALLELPHVTEVIVDALSGRIVVKSRGAPLDTSAMRAEIDALGYHLVDDQVESDGSLQVSALKLARKKMLWRWLVAGLGMMQIMMFTSPLYFSPEEITAEQAQLLNWAAWVLSVPVLIFSCRPFFQSAWSGVKTKTVSMDLTVSLSIAVVFLFGTAVTFAPQVTALGRDTYLDSMAMFVFFLLSGRWIESRLRVQTASALASVIDRLPRVALQLDAASGEFRTAPVDQIRGGATIRVLPGGVFPADGTVLTEGSWVDEAVMTGESTPVFKQTGAAVVSGTINQSHVVDIKVTAVGAATRYSQMVQVIEGAASQKPPIVVLADRIAQPFLIVVCLLAVLVFAYYARTDLSVAVIRSVTVLLVTCPCALALATPAALLASTGALARAGILVRNIAAISSIARIDVALFDKTGTLTADEITLAATQPLLAADDAQITRWCRWAKVLASQSSHPRARAISNGLTPGLAVEGEHVRDVREIAGSGLTGTVFESNAEPSVLRLGSARWLGQSAAADDADGALYFSVNDVPVLRFSLAEVIRRGALEAIQDLKTLGVRPIIASGDRATAVARLGATLAIPEAHAECTPEAKLELLNSAQAQGSGVLAIGDGMNDGAILAKANVSIAMGSGVPIAQNHADFIFVRDDLTLLPRIIAHARLTESVITQNLVWAAAYNLSCVPLALLGFLPPWVASIGMVMSSLIVLCNALRLNHLTKQSADEWKASSSWSHSPLPSCC